MIYKLGTLTKGGEDIAFSYRNRWATEGTIGSKRLIIAPKQAHVSIMQDLASFWTGGYFVLYVLLVSHTGRKPGRYESPHPLKRSEVQMFLDEYRNFLESDGRHHIWIGSVQQAGTLVYDQHDVI